MALKGLKRRRRAALLPHGPRHRRRPDVLDGHHADHPAVDLHHARRRAPLEPENCSGGEGVTPVSAGGGAAPLQTFVMLFYSFIMHLRCIPNYLDNDQQ